MMTLRDSVQLAAAKLRTHRIRTGIIVVIASLLFAGIVLVLSMLTGAARSAQSFGTEGLGSRFIVQARPIVDNMVMNTGTPEIFDTLKARTATLKAEKKAAAKRLNQNYDPANDMNLPVSEYKNANGGTDYFLNPSHPETKAALDAYVRSIKHIGFDDFSNLANNSGAKQLYKSSGGVNMGNFGVSPGLGDASVVPIIEGKELAYDQTKASGNYSTEPRGVATLTTLGWTYFNSSLLTPFVLPGQNLALGKEGDVPVIAPISAAEQVLGMPNLPATATTQQRLERLVTLRRDIAGKTTSLCYRNGTSSNLLEQAKSQAKDMAANKGKAGYTAPSLQYAIPVDPCGEVTLKKDTRSYDEKKQAADELSFKKQYENYQEPTQGILKVRIVGFSQDLSYQQGFSARSIIESVLQTGLGQGWFSPSEAITDGSIAAKIQPSIAKKTNAEQVYYAEFASLTAAKQFAEEFSCDSKVMLSNMSDMPKPGQSDPRVVDCYKMGKYFDIAPFGNNASAIEDMRRGVWKVMRYVAPAVLLIASLVLMGIVGKIIADSRRETAVFRALGATRFAIAQIYLTYSLFIGIFIVLISFTIGSVGALLLDHKLSPDASVSAVLAYNAQDIHKQFSFYGFDFQYAAIIIGLIAAAAILSTALPLMTNIRRNPIRDMRDEN
ncbi:ABC transporter permease [Candidatus Saccharibacteria bacterium]|nr:MAG: ABC transporter permease [Candidatus Saccharibacteria bacterium]